MDNAPQNRNSGFVLLGFAEALSSPEVAWSLVDAGFRVGAFSRKGRKSALRHSRYVKVLEITAPETDFPAAVKDLNSVLLQSRPQNAREASVLFPLDDAALWMCCQRSLPEGWTLAGPSVTGLDFALDKSIQTSSAVRAGLQVPQTTLATAAKEVLARTGELPLILRPAKAVNPNGNRLRKGSNWICASRQELDRAMDQWREEYPLLVQPYIAGTGVGVFGFASVRGVEGWSAHRRLRMMNPHGSGSSACASRAVPEELTGPIERLLKEKGWRGLFMVEFLEDESGRYWFIEFNGRSWGSMALSRRQGLEYPAWNANLALDRTFPIRSREQSSTEVVCRNLGRELMHLLFVLRGRKTKAIRKWPSFWRSAMEVLCVHRRDCFYNFRRDDLRVFFSDCICTVSDQLSKPRRREQKA